MADLTLSALTIYPIKSAAGIAVEHWPVDELGLRYDRRWMVVDDQGQQVTQREYPGLALVRPRIADGRLHLSGPGLPSLDLPLRPTTSVLTSVRVWGDICQALWTGERASRWFSDLLGFSCGLVYMPDGSRRQADPTYAPAGTHVSFVDAFPFLLLSSESLADLNARLPDPVPMNRFRPNLVISGGSAFAEDGLESFRIGAITFRTAKPCARCVLTTIDQATGVRSLEPLRTLATYRRAGTQVRFGQNVVHRGLGELRIGERLA